MTFILPQEQSQSAFGETLVAPLTLEVSSRFDYNIHSEIVTSTTLSTGTIGQTSGKIRLQTGAGAAGSATVTSKRVLRYINGMGIVARFTAYWSSGGAASSRQIIGIGNTTDGLFFGYDGTSFGVIRYQNGSKTTVAQASWNVDVMDGTGVSGMTLDTTKGNVFQIKFQHLGFGQITFSIEDSTTGMFQDVHRIRYANANTDPHVFNPSFQFRAEVTNIGNTTNLNMYSASWGGFVEGNIRHIGPRKSVGATIAATTTEAPIFSIRSDTTFQGATNRVPVKLDCLSISTVGTKTPIIYLKRDTTPTLPSWTNINSNTSTISYDITATAFTGGVAIFTFFLSANTSQIIDLSNYNIFLNNGDTLTVSADMISGSSGVSAGLSWTEDF